MSRWSRKCFILLGFLVLVPASGFLLPMQQVTKMPSSFTRVLPPSRFSMSLDDNHNNEMTSVPVVDPIYLIPIIVTISAFNLYHLTASGLHSVVQRSHSSWISVDGGAYLADIIAPAINGPVLTSISILLGTLTAITISSLYDRQNQIRSCVVAEFEEIRQLGIMTQSFPSPHRETASAWLIQHLEQLTSDTFTGELTTQSLRHNPQLDQLLMLLNKMSAQAMDGDDLTSVSDNILGSCYSSLDKINTQRCNLITSIQSTFPALHYVTLGVLAVSVCLVFLVETYRDVLFFLAAFQLKGMWALLLGVFSLLAVVIYDLNTPFAGTYNIVRVSEEDVLRVMEYMEEPLRENNTSNINPSE